MRIILFLLIACNLAFSQQSTIILNNVTYSNDSVYIYKYSDLITKKLIPIASGIVSKDGTFTCNYMQQQTALLVIPLHYYNIILYSEPSKKYELLIPNKKTLDVADELNPYFKPTEITPGMANSDTNDLNFLINKFDENYNAFLNKNFTTAYHYARKAFTDSAINSISQKFIYSNNEFLKIYMKYKFNMLKYMAYERDNNYIAKYYFNNEQIFLNNDSYMEMFNEIFKNYLSFSSVKKWGENIYNDIAKAKSPTALRVTLKNNPALSNDTLIDLIILKGIYDALYNKNTEYQIFPQKQLLMTLDSMTICAKTVELKQIANNIKQKYSYLNSGSKAPIFSMLNQDSVRISLSDLKGKYLYIYFTDLRSYSTKTELDLLKIISEKYKNNIEVVTVCCKSNLNKTKAYLTETDYKWQFLTPDNTKQTLNEYNIKALPSYILSDPYGNIVLNQAPPPDLSFEKIFISILKSRN